MTFVAYFFIVSFFVGLFICYTKIYFKRLSVIRVTSSSSDLVAVRPSPSWIRSVRSDRSCFVSLGFGYVAFQCNCDESDGLDYSDLQFDGVIYIFRQRFGRLRSVDLSDRRLNDILRKFKRG